MSDGFESEFELTPEERGCLISQGGYHPSQMAPVPYERSEAHKFIPTIGRAPPIIDGKLPPRVDMERYIIESIIRKQD